MYLYIKYKKNAHFMKRKGSLLIIFHLVSRPFLSRPRGGTKPEINLAYS